MHGEAEQIWGPRVSLQQLDFYPSLFASLSSIPHAGPVKSTLAGSSPLPRLVLGA